MPQDVPEQLEPDAEPVEIHNDFRVRNEPPISTKILWFLREQIPLAEAVCVAVSIHVVAFPSIWFIGWALPWPRPAVVTTIMEFDLTDWPKHVHTPKRVFNYRDPKLNP